MKAKKNPEKKTPSPRQMIKRLRKAFRAPAPESPSQRASEACLKSHDPLKTARARSDEQTALSARREWDLNPRMTVLQTVALGHLAIPPWSCFALLRSGAASIHARARSVKHKVQFFSLLRYNGVISSSGSRRPGCAHPDACIPPADWTSGMEMAYTSFPQDHAMEKGDSPPGAIHSRGEAAARLGAGEG